MVTRVDKFLGGLGADVTSVANVHATENRIAFGASMNPTANVHVTGNAHITTTLSTGGNITGGGTYTGGGTMTTGGNIVIPNDGDVGSVGATDAIQISSGGIVTFKDDIKIKDGGTIGVASAADAMTVSSAGIVTFKDDILIKDGGTIGSASATTAITIASTGIVTFVDDILIKNDGTIGSAGAATAMTIDSNGIVTFVDDIKIKDGGTIGVASKADAITIASDGDTAIAGGIGIAGNTAPVATALSLGTPANVVVRTHAASGSGNVIIGDATATSAFSLDVRGTANTGALTASGLAFPTSDGSANEVLKTDGSGTLSFTAISSNAITSGDTVVNAIDPNITFVTNGAEEARITAAGNLVLGSTTATHLLDIRGTANTGVLTASGLTFPSSDGSADQAIVTDGSGALSFATVLTSSDPATTLAATPDLGSVAGGSTQDAFGQNLGGLTETDLLDEPSGSLSTLDAGALS